MSYNTLLVMVGVGMLGAAAGAVGCYAVLKRRSLTGDAVAHGALPGLCLAFLIVGERDLESLLIGAFLSGLAGILTISLLRRFTRLKEDAALAIVLAVFFGLGIVLLSVITNLKDAGGSRAGLDSFILGKTTGIRLQDVKLILWLALGTLVVILLFYKEFKLVAFDPGFAQVQGWPAYFLDLGLQLLLIVAVIIGLPVVGVVLMAALLIIPAAAARFWTERLSVLLLLSASFGLVAAPLGAYASMDFDLPAGPAIILAAALVFLISLLLAPRRGLLARWGEQTRYRTEVREKQLLAFLHEHDGVEEDELARALHWSSRQLHTLVRRATRQDWLEREGRLIHLTAAGKDRAETVVKIKEAWQRLLLEDPQQTPGLLRLDLPPP